MLTNHHVVEPVNQNPISIQQAQSNNFGMEMASLDSSPKRSELISLENERLRALMLQFPNNPYVLARLKEELKPLQKDADDKRKDLGFKIKINVEK
jgi:hypothetical protein